MTTVYDVIIVGARCAGSPTAMLLARSGYRVLLVDKATFPERHDVDALDPPAGRRPRWRAGACSTQLEATGCPPVTTLLVRLRADHDRGIAAAGATAARPRTARAGSCSTSCSSRPPPRPAPSCAKASPSRRSLVDDGGVHRHPRPRARAARRVTERARVVIGADGKHSLVAKAVGAERYNEVPPLQSGYYAYWSGLPVDGFETVIRAEIEPRLRRDPDARRPDLRRRRLAVAQFEANRKDYRGQLPADVRARARSSPSASAARRARRASAAPADLPNFFRKPYGPGWALVGDAGYHKDPITAFGISDAFRDAEALRRRRSTTSFAGRRAFEEAMADFQQARDDASRCRCTGSPASSRQIEPPPPEMQQLLGAVARQPGGDGRLRQRHGRHAAGAGVLRPENVGRDHGRGRRSDRLSRGHGIRRRRAS